MQDDMGPTAPSFRLSVSSVMVPPGNGARNDEKALKFIDAHEAFILKKGEEGVPVAEICRGWTYTSNGIKPGDLLQLELSG